MSNTRIEREAKEYAEKIWHGIRACIATSAGKVQSRIDYKAAANSEINRAAPVVKALEDVIALHAKEKSPPNKFIDGLKKVLETYKADV